MKKFAFKIVTTTESALTENALVMKDTKEEVALFFHAKKTVIIEEGVLLVNASAIKDIMVRRVITK
jgi:hypothetical protein